MWKTEYKKTFLKELSKIPTSVRTKIEKIVFKELICDNPYKLGLIEKLKGYDNIFKIRVGDLRIGLTHDNNTNTITLNRVANRKDIYKMFP